MLELPEAATIARQLNETVVGKTVARVVAANSPHRFAWYFKEPSEYAARLEGRTIESAHTFGGRPELWAGEARVAFADGVNIRYLPPDTPEPKKHQLYIAFTDGSALACSVQMYGGLWVYPDGEKVDFYHAVAHSAPSPLTDAFDARYFAALLGGAKKLSVKGFLATEQRIPGLGNGVLQDILWCARLHPKRKMMTLTNSEFSALYQAVKVVLREMSERGGRDTERDLFGNYGGYQTAMSKQNVSMICPVCGGSISRESYMGGNIYFCTSCQIYE